MGRRRMRRRRRRNGSRMTRRRRTMRMRQELRGGERRSNRKMRTSPHRIQQSSRRYGARWTLLGPSGPSSRALLGPLRGPVWALVRGGILFFCDKLTPKTAKGNA
eukprot:5090722-Pyramimonas_sp.AAC.1